LGIHYAQNVAFVHSLGSICPFDVWDMALVVHAYAMVTKLEKKYVVNRYLTSAHVHSEIYI